MRCYKVGGCIRDGMLGLEVKDTDWVVTGSTPEEMAARGLRTEVRVGIPLWYAGLPESLRQPEFSAVLGAMQWAVKHRNRPDQERPRGSGERNWSPASLFRRPFARSGSRRVAAEPEPEDE